ncbi:MAG: squalene/phytoene synthase family protein [Armatimonadetes bacterium]|nr:squalene/phytoene synthase family protein [Armatimonadota bacterium]
MPVRNVDPPLSLEASYHLCDGIAREKARNFYYGFRLLERPRRLALSAVYAFFRAVDDVADGEASAAIRARGLNGWRDRLDAALREDPYALAAAPELPALCDAVRRYAIPVKCFHDLLDGAIMDLEVDRYETFEDLYGYCYRVASTVGLVCVHVFGFDGSDEALQMAEWCGIAFQLTNIMRDVEEDALLGRVYLPQEDLRRFGLRGDDLTGMQAGLMDKFRGVMALEGARARSFYLRSAPLVDRIIPQSRGAFEAMAGIYRGLLDKIERERYAVFGRRVSLSKAAKIGLLLKGLLR